MVKYLFILQASRKKEKYKKRQIKKIKKDFSPKDAIFVFSCFTFVV